MKQYWLMKSEPEAYSIDDLERDGCEPWDGIRNYQARNFMMNDMNIGDEILFYHSSCKVPGVVGRAKVDKKAYPDHTAWDPEAKYYDPKSNKENPRWFMVDVAFIAKFPRVVSLSELRDTPELSQMRLLQKGNRLSILPLSEDEYQKICSMSEG